MNKLLYLMGGESNDSAVMQRSAKCLRILLFFFAFFLPRRETGNNVQSRWTVFVPLEFTETVGDVQEVFACCRRTLSLLSGPHQKKKL